MQKVTKAMQMVAAAKFRRSQESMLAARPYMESLSSLIMELLPTPELGTYATGFVPPFFDPGKRDVLLGSGQVLETLRSHLLIVCSAERGLCGSFNSSIMRFVRERAYALEEQGRQVKFLCIGKKGYDILRRSFHDSHFLPPVEIHARTFDFSKVQHVAQDIIDRFEKGEFDWASVFYGHFQSAMVQTPTVCPLIPFALPPWVGLSNESCLLGDRFMVDPTKGDEALLHYKTEAARNTSHENSDETDSAETEPTHEVILSSLVDRAVAARLFYVMLENFASEQGARMVAMDNATRNAGDMLRKQTLIYNRTRQAMITRDLIEIIAGAEALG
jgi:F-type H+-transporting ATPase subunit gamma